MSIKKEDKFPIEYNKHDKYLKSILKGIENLGIIKTVKNPKTLFIYGVSGQRMTDIVLSAKFPNSSILLNNFKTLGLATKKACYWSMSDTYNNYVLGLGENIRKNSPDNAKKAIVLTFLSLNDKIYYPELVGKKVKQKDSPFDGEYNEEDIKLTVPTLAAKEY